MNEFESDWISLSQSQGGVRVFWVNLREDNKVSESKMTVSESNMAEFKMATIIKLSQNEWVKFFFVQNGGNQDGRIQDGWHYQVEWEWMSLSQIELVWVRVLCKMAEFKMVELKMAAIIKLSDNEWVKFFFVQNGGNQDGRIQDGWHHQVEWEWISLSQIELVWVRVLCKMAESKMAEFKMAAIIRLIRLN